MRWSAKLLAKTSCAHLKIAINNTQAVKANKMTLLDFYYKISPCEKAQGLIFIFLYMQYIRINTQLFAAAARFAISAAFFTRLSRRRIHFARIIALGLAAAIRAKHFVRIDLYQLVKFLAARFAFVL